MFAPLERCWVCGGRALARYHQCRFEFQEYATQDPELHAYTGATLWLVRCADCGFGQPEAVPTLPGFFDRMYDQRWSPEWIEREFDAGYKDFIFEGILRELGRRLPPASRRLLDVGAHVGRFMNTAQRHGWRVEGIELNPATAACAARRTGAPVHQVNAHTLTASRAEYDAVTLTDVLEHIPEPVAVLTSVGRLLAPGGWLAAKVPCGRSQYHKERVLSTLKPGRRVSLADNLVHVNHFTPRSLEAALARAGFRRIVIRAGAPELIDPAGLGSRLSNTLRMAVFTTARLPGGVRTPLALNLQAYAMKAARS
jgi:SAM-dependent methyltransferase